MRSSRAAVDLIVANEVTSRAVYERKYQHPEWPGGASGITVGIGYDLGYNETANISSDWAAHVDSRTVVAMQRYAGAISTRAQAKLSEARSLISVPWDAAMAVFMEVSLPKFEALTLRACPRSDELPAGCFGVLSSLTYNRGASYTKTGDRYREMRAIRAAIIGGQWDEVPAQIRSMKRLWPGVAGLLRRREEEAALWEASLRAAPAPVESAVSARFDTGDDKSDGPDEGVTPTGNEHPNLNVQPERAPMSFKVKLLQMQLIAFKYYEVGDPDGKMGGKFVAGASAFMNDRGYGPNHGDMTPQLEQELAKAKEEKLPDGSPWSRPIAETRANATAKDIAPKVASVNATWYQKLLAWLLGLPAAAGAGLKGLFGEDTTGGYIQQVKDIFSAIPTEFYLLGIVGLAGAIFFAAKTAQDATVKDYNEGKIN